MVPRWLRLPDLLPQVGEDRIVGAIYAPAFCLTHDQSRLTDLNHACVELGASQICQGRARILVISGAYRGPVMEKELLLRERLAESRGVPREKILKIREIIDTRDELMKLAAVLRELDSHSVMFVSDEYHMPRLIRWAKELLPGIRIYHVSIRRPRYERAYEPASFKLLGFAKSLRSGSRPLWIIWQVIFYFATPLLLRKAKRR